MFRDYSAPTDVELEVRILVRGEEQAGTIFATARDADGDKVCRRTADILDIATPTEKQALKSMLERWQSLAISKLVP